MKNIFVLFASVLVFAATVFAFCQCSEFPNEKKVYYFYNAKELFKKHENKTNTHYSIFIPYVYDSFAIGPGGKSYILEHYPNFNLYDILLEADQPGLTQTLPSSNIIVRDTLFVKHKSVLDTIDYFDSKWVKKEKNLEKFWGPVKYRGGRYYDSLRIYTIEPIEGTDSLIFRRVHRDLFQAWD